MTISETVKQSAMEVVMTSLRKSKDGIVLSVVIHPSDIRREILTDPIGQRYMMALVPIGDDEQPNTVSGSAPAEASTTVGEPEEHRDRAATRSERSKQAYAQSSPAMKAVVRAAILCEDPLFQTWMDADDSDQAAIEVRKYCHVDSRADISKDERALRLFLELEDRFQRSRPMLEVVAR